MYFKLDKKLTATELPFSEDGQTGDGVRGWVDMKGRALWVEEEFSSGLMIMIGVQAVCWR
jgi:hypothetical protein